jgi:plastocyanin
LGAAGISLLGLLAGCGADDREAPTPDDFAIEKPAQGSGDEQVGIVGRPLPEDLRVLVTRAGEPAEGITVYWSTAEGSVSPTSDLTDADGISSSRWTLKDLFAQQGAFASLEPAGPPQVVFLAIAAPDPEAVNTVKVLNDGGNRFEPASITVTVGDTVNWFWPVGSVGHNILPDDGDLPPNSGAPADHPKFLSFRFTIPGVYHYHCTVHGGPGGVGMAGTVTVRPPPPTD